MLSWKWQVQWKNASWKDWKVSNVIHASYRAMNTHQLEGMKPEECQALEALRQEKDMDCDWEDAGNVSFGDILNGTEQLEVSNAGGELMDLTQELMGDLCKE